MAEYTDLLNSEHLKRAATTELEHIRKLGSNLDLVMATSNLGAYEALLMMLAEGDAGLPVYKLVTEVESRYASQSGIITRLRAMRQRGLVVERPGRKKSQVLLAASDDLIRQLGPVLIEGRG